MKAVAMKETVERRGRKPGVVSAAFKKMAKLMHAKGYATVAEAADIVDVARPTIYSWIKIGQLKDVKKVHNTVWVSKAELEPFKLSAIAKAV